MSAGRPTPELSSNFTFSLSIGAALPGFILSSKWSNNGDQSRW